MINCVSELVKIMKNNNDINMFKHAMFLSHVNDVLILNHDLFISIIFIHVLLAIIFTFFVLL